MTVAKRGLTRQFLLGALTGAFALLCVLAGGAAIMARRGVRVDVDIEPLAVLVRENVTGEAERSLPEMLTEMKAEVPEMVATRMSERMQASATINLADFTLELPESATKVIQEQLQAVVEDIVYECFAEFDTDLAAAQLGDEAYELVKTSIASEAAEVALRYRLFGRVPVPVTLNFR